MPLKSYPPQPPVIVYPLISDGAFELLPSSEIEQTILYRDHRLKCMLNIVSFVRECIKVKRACSQS